MQNRSENSFGFFYCMFNIRNSYFKILFSKGHSVAISHWFFCHLGFIFQSYTSLSLKTTAKARGMVLRPLLGIFLSSLVIQPTSRPQVPRTQTSRPESPGMTSPSPRIQIISTDSAVASPQRIQVPAPVPLGSSHLPKCSPPFPESFPKTNLPESFTKSCASWASSTVQLHFFFEI